MKKKLLLTLLLGVFCFSCAAAEEKVSFFSREYPVLCCEPELTLEDNWKLFFTDDAEDMPWIELEELADILTLLERDIYGMNSFVLTYDQEGVIYTLQRENGCRMIADSSDNTLTFDNYNGFVMRPNMDSLQDLLYYSGFNENGEAELFQRDTLASYDRMGDIIVIPLDDYDIHLMTVDGKGYIPLQTVNDFLFAPLMNRVLLFNGNSVFFARKDDMIDASTYELTPLGSLYYSAEPTDRSETLAEYCKNELCLMLDYLYGLKQRHNIVSFGRLFWQIGFDEPLASTSAVDADNALKLFINYFLDDLHSVFSLPSWMTGISAELSSGYGASALMVINHEDEYKAVRSRVMDGEVSDYMEVGNTAYVTFDEFLSGYDAASYYNAAADNQRIDDTIGLIVYANAQIKRENSPIENVVIDLSNNTGGDADAALYVISWILGQAEICVDDSMTGAQSTMVYRADVNLDRIFDENDTLQGKRVFCLISPVSFSCGNLVPAVCKANQAVTLIGRTSGGGSCMIMKMTSACGSMFTISGNKRLAFRKNGSFYDIDEGVAPDVYISNLETLYDRPRLTELINSLP
ncbi:MAG: hypothetical protein IJ246_05125 [Clostridia bacterium]|nr:hypothetical protein [Clostridia bacterium]